MSNIHKHVLPNGVRMLVEPVTHVKSAAVGLWCRTGSRNELANEAGITHLIEHMLFKGTPTRTSKQIAESIEGGGGSLNAFTDKEATCYYCRVLAEEVETGVDVLTDMMLHSLIDPEELKREQGVVLEEIKRSEDEPSDHVHELHLAARWPSHQLGKPIIGTKESVSGFVREDLVTYMSRRYTGGNVMLAIAGNVDVEAVKRSAEIHLGKLPSGAENDVLPKPSGVPGHKEIAKDVEQVHFCIGADGCSLYDDEIYTLAVLDGGLGGSMSSRLFQEIREKRGLAYSIGSYTLSYTAGGAFTVSGGTSSEHWQNVQELVRLEIDKVIKDGLEPDELVRTKKNLTGNLMLSLEGMSSRMMRMSRNELNFGREIPVEETVAKVNAVTNEGLTDLAAKLLGAAQMSTTAIVPQ